MVRKPKKQGGWLYVNAKYGEGIEQTKGKGNKADYIHDHAVDPPGGAAAVAAGAGANLGGVPGTEAPVHQWQCIHAACVRYVAAMRVVDSFRCVAQFDERALLPMQQREVADF